MVPCERDDRRVCEQRHGRRTADPLAAGRTRQRRERDPLGDLDPALGSPAAVGAGALAEQPHPAAVEAVHGREQVGVVLVVREAAGRERQLAHVALAVRTADRHDVVGGPRRQVAVAQGARLRHRNGVAVHALRVRAGGERPDDPSPGVGEPVPRLDLLDVVAPELPEVVREPGGRLLVGRLEQLGEGERRPGVALGERRHRRHPGRRREQAERVGGLGVHASR
ncbi:hypothetical protein [Halosegnis marinus]|uniref:hypothetical protein n=1 Tax=Halosegnis marinus TaxID=3034023 RepID=UPI00362142B0